MADVTCALIAIINWLESHNGAIVGIATIFIAIFTIALARSTKRLWKSTEKSISLARQEFISTHRPRIRIKHVWLSEDIQAGEPIKVNIVTVNTGDTDARIVRFDVVTCTVPKYRHPPNNPFNERPGNSTETVLPSGITLDHLPRDAGYVNLSEIGDIRSGSIWLYCFAYVEYLDAFNLQRKTSCCRILKPSPREALSIIDGQFVRPEAESEYEYTD